KGWSNIFGGTGKPVIGAVFSHYKVDAVAVKDNFIDLNYMTYMFQFESIHGKLKGTVKAKSRDPTNIKWGDAADEYAVESKAEGCALLEAGAKKISISTHSTNALKFGIGVNHEKYENFLKTVRNASCRTSCLASLARVIHDNVGIVEGLVTIVYAITATKKTLPGPAGKLWHDRGFPEHYSCFYTDATKVVGMVIPELNREHTGMAFHVPTHKVSVVDLSCCLKYYNIKKPVKQALEDPLKGILGFTEDQIVTCNIKNDTQSSTFDPGTGVVLNDHLVKFIFKYGNEFGYSNMLVNYMSYIALKE
uniref:Glyceraldehyde-3-phosphate dehydrogenase n=1 Tax=Mustela putorius furo TaxID=9669 RepID=M3Y3S3_MUSPF